MAAYYEGTFDTVANYLAALAAFGADNGWVVSVNTTTKVVMAKAGIEFTSEYSNATSINRSITVGGSTSPVLLDQNFSVGYKYGFYSVGNNLYFSREYLYSASVTVHWGGVFTITEKCGTWSGGACLALSYTSSATRIYGLFGSQPYYRSALLKDGAWSTAGSAAAAGRLWTSWGQEWGTVWPNYFNAVVVPCPVLAGVYDANTAYFIPIGMLPGVYTQGRGNVYAAGEQITINGSTYLFAYNSSNLLFKIS